VSCPAGSPRPRARPSASTAPSWCSTRFTEGPPEDLYHDHSDLGAEPLQLDAAPAAQLTDWYLLADAALRAFAPGKTPVLWPEHFDVAIDLQDVTFGASPGDGFCPVPYAYVSTSSPGTDADYWNAPFGAYVKHTEAPTIDALVAFWKKAR
jgi:hypothetical protein